MVTIPSPPMLQGNQNQQLQDVRRYLYRLVDMLNLSLNSLTAENFAEKAAQALGGASKEAIAQTETELKSLIVKNATTVQETIQRITARLESEYVAQSEFGTFRETMTNDLTQTAAGLEQEIATRSEVVDNFIAETNGYIRQGIVGFDGATPIIGIAIGQNITQTQKEVGGTEYTVIDTSRNMSVWTTKRLSFYVNGSEVAYFANDNLYVTGVYTGSVTLPGWSIDSGNGLLFRYTGETGGTV